MRLTPPSPSASTLSRNSARASAPSSTNSAKAAPRDSASIPSAPVPANRSSTRAARERIAIGMGENVEQGLAQTIGGRADGLRLRPLQRPSAEPSADDAHSALSFAAKTGRLAATPRRFGIIPPAIFFAIPTRLPAFRASWLPSWLPRFAGRAGVSLCLCSPPCGRGEGERREAMRRAPGACRAPEPSPRVESAAPRNPLPTPP